MIPKSSSQIVDLALYFSLFCIGSILHQALQSSPRGTNFLRFIVYHHQLTNSLCVCVLFLSGWSKKRETVDILDKWPNGLFLCIRRWRRSWISRMLGLGEL